MKNNLDFYRHKVESHNHWKFKTLRLLYERTFKVDGWAGEGKFWALNNLIASSDYCLLEYDNEIKLASLASEIGFTLEEFNTYLDILINKCKLVILMEGKLATEYTQEILAEVQNDRRAARERKRRALQNLELDKKLGNGKKNVGNSGQENGVSRGTMSVFGGTSEKFGAEKQHSTVQYSTVQNSNTILPDADAPGGKDDNVGGGKAAARKGTAGEGKKKVAAKKKDRPEDTTAHWKEMVGVYNKFFPDHYNGEKFSWNATEFANLSKLLKDLERRAKDQGKEWTLAEAMLRFQQFLQIAHKDFVLNQDFAPKNLYSKRNRIYQSLSKPVTNGSHQQTPAANGHTAENLRRAGLGKSQGAYELLDDLKRHLGGNIDTDQFDPGGKEGS